MTVKKKVRLKWTQADTFNGVTAHYGMYTLYATEWGWSVAGPTFYTSGKSNPRSLRAAKASARKELLTRLR